MYLAISITTLLSIMVAIRNFHGVLGPQRKLVTMVVYMVLEQNLSYRHLILLLVEVLLFLVTVLLTIT